VTGQNELLFNFAASPIGGGYKRLYEYARWFDANGGASFVIHSRCSALIERFPRNRFVVARQSKLGRLLNDCAYLHSLAKPRLYYAYGIPMYFRFGTLNWSHVSNVLPLAPDAVPLSTALRLQMRILGARMKAGFARAEVISAESQAALEMLGPVSRDKQFVSVNGSDDELALIGKDTAVDSENVATIVGTASYKALDDSYRVFEQLRAQHSGLKLLILGEPSWVPKQLRGLPDVEIRGMLPRPEVVECLRRTRFYISTTRIENSYNAAAEGIFIARESYISDIGPHRELLQGMAAEEVLIPGVQRPLLHVHRDALRGTHLKSWETVIQEMLARYSQELS
jgi:hypothetical protein